MPRVYRPSPLVRMLLACATAAGLSLGCGAHDDNRGPAKPPPLATVTPAPTATVAVTAEPTATAVATADPPPSTPPPPADPFAPPSGEIAQALAAIPVDPPPPKLASNTHYMISNEDRPQVFRDVAKDRGGAYVGVGSEQNWILASWARAEFMFLMDFDDWVVDINEVHGLVIQHAKTPDEVVDAWSPSKSDQVKGWIKEATPDAAAQEKRLKVFDKGRAQVYYRLTWLKNRPPKQQMPFFANDQAELDHVKKLWSNKRVKIIRGDLTAGGTLKTFGDVCKKAGWTVRVLYMSNAEFYFDYAAGSFKDNLKNLPYDDRSVVLHTQPENRTDYLYVYQDAKAYLPWIAKTKNFRDLLNDSKILSRGKFENGVWFITPP